MKMTSTTDLEFPGLYFAMRQGEVKVSPADPEAAAGFSERVYPSVPEAQMMAHASGTPDVLTTLSPCWGKTSCEAGSSAYRPKTSWPSTNSTCQCAELLHTSLSAPLYAKLREFNFSQIS